MKGLSRLLRLPRIRKRKMILFLIFGVIIYFTYQFGLISELSLSKKENKIKPIKEEIFDESNKSLKHKNVKLMKPNKIIPHPETTTSGSMFRCRKSKKLISSDKVNDDYCDCPEDGSDEFLTDACLSGFFFCKSSKQGFPSKIVSAWVNDGVCDCCDGSDEWQEKNLIESLPQDYQKVIHRFVSPCLALC